MSLDDILKDVENLEETLKCKICSRIFNDPFLIAKCGHTTCKQCFVENFEMKCPVCNISVNSKDSLEDKQMNDLILHLDKLKCLLNKSKNSKDDEMKSISDPAVEIEKKLESPQFTSTPVVRKRKKLSSKGTPHLSSSCEDNIIAKTPETSGKKILLVNLSKQTNTSSEKKKVASSIIVSNADHRSPIGNLNKKNHKGETLLHRAVIKGDIAKVKQLLNEGAAVNTQDNNGWTPLHEASNHGFLEITELLLDSGALVNVPSLKENVTPLHDAIINDQIPIAILLVSRGADLHSRTSLGYTALDLCKNGNIKNVLIESCSPFISANISLSNVKESAKNSGKMILLSTNLNENQKLCLQKCAQMLKADIVDDFSSEVTHIVTSCDNMGNCTRTLKILLGILSGKWIMNYLWIDACLNYKQKIEEEVFEVQGTKTQPNTQGPKLGRENVEQKFPPLFDGFCFYLHGHFTKPTPEREDLLNLIHTGGGKILSREPRAETVLSEPQMVPYHAPGTPLENISHIILYQEKPPRGIHLHSDHISTTQVIWLIECISEFKILEARTSEKEK